MCRIVAERHRHLNDDDMYPSWIGACHAWCVHINRYNCVWKITDYKTIILCLWKYKKSVWNCKHNWFVPSMDWCAWYMSVCHIWEKRPIKEKRDLEKGKKVYMIKETYKKRVCMRKETYKRENTWEKRPIKERIHEKRDL